MSIDKVVDKTLEVRAATIGKIWSFIKKYFLKGALFVLLTIVVIVAFIFGSYIKEKESRKYSRHFET